MKVKTLFKSIIGAACLFLLFQVPASALTKTLFKHSSNTYVTSWHGDNYFDDEYKGTASVIGTDRLAQNNKTYSFAWTRITYDVQGEVVSGTASSTGHYDNVRKQKSVTAYDKWNNGPKTTAKYNYGLRLFSNVYAQGDPMNNMSGEDKEILDKAIMNAK